MSFKYNTNPVSSNKIIPEGTYDAIIYAVTEKDKDGQPLVSKKSGEAMQKVTFEVYAPDRNAYINQYFTAESMAYFYKKLAIALDQGAAFEAGTFDANNFLQAAVKLQIVVKPSKETGDDQNNIKAFLPAKAMPVGATAFSAPRQQTAQKPRASEHPLATQREIAPEDVPF